MNLPVKHTQAWARVFFYSPRNLYDLRDYSKNDILFVQADDIININVTTTVTDSAGTFSITISNTNQRYLVDDDIEKSLEYLNDVEESYKAKVPDDMVIAGTERQKIVDTNPRNFTYYKNEDAFLNFAYETVIINEKRYRVYYEITPNDIENDQSGDTRIHRWFFEPKMDPDTGTYKDTAVFITCTKNDDGTYTYTRDDTGEELIVERHTNKEFYTKYKGQIKKTRLKIKPMDHVFIFMATSTNNDQKPIFYRVFTGVVNRVSRDKTNVDNITVSGEDITKYLRLSVFAENPAIFSSKLLKAYKEPDKNFLMSKVYSNKTAAEIVKEMVLGVVAGMSSTVDEGSAIHKANVYTDGGTTNANSMKETDIVTYTEEELTDSSVAQQMFFTAGKIKIQEPSDTILRNMDHYKPYTTIYGGNVPDLQTEYRDRRQICQEIAKIMDFEFFADPDGVIHFKQPNYDNYHILNSEHPEWYIIDSESMRSFSISEDDSQLITFIRVTGAEDIIGTAELLGMYAEAINYSLVDTYGIRIYDVTSPLVSKPEDCKLYAKSIMRRINSDLVSAQVDIDLRPQLRAGYPVYIPELNRIFYVKEVTHNFNYGGDCKTSLGLSYGRVPWDVLPELLTYYNDKFGISEPYENKNSLKFKDAITTKDTTDERDEQKKRYNSDINYIIVHHLGHSLKGRTFDFIIKPEGIYTTQQWASRLNSEVPFSYRHLFHKTHLMPHDLTVDFGPIDDYGLCAKNTMHICLWENFTDNIGSGNCRRIMVNLVAFFKYLLLAVFNSNSSAGYSTLEALEDPEHMMTVIKSHGDFISNACTVGCCGRLVTTNKQTKLTKRDMSIETLFKYAIDSYQYIIKHGLQKQLK